MKQKYIMLILKFIQLRNAGVFKHTLKVRSVARNIYNTLRKNTDLQLPEKKEIENAALLHDVGKLYIPSAVLNKVSPLSAQELESIKLHPEWGVDFVKDVPELLYYKDYILFHHILDGYPQRLIGSINPTSLPVGIKLLIIADVFAALTEDRPYRKSVNSAAAVWIMKKKVKTLFDHEVSQLICNTLTSNSLSGKGVIIESCVWKENITVGMSISF